MFFQTISKKQIQSVAKIDLYDQLQFIVVTVLKRDLSTHYEGNHILYTASVRLAELKELASYHREKINMYTFVGQFHKDAYELTIQNANQLQLIIDSYISLHIESDRERINRRLSLLDEQVKAIHSELIQFHKQKVLPQLLESFWKSIKDDLMPVLAELR